MSEPLDQTLPADRFWEEHYRDKVQGASGRPSTVLVEFGSRLPPGDALDLGCAHGDDSLWLALRGWRVLGVDISATVLARATERAETAGVSDRVRFERHDLADSFPEGAFDLVSALFLQSPVEFPRAAVLQRAAQAVAPGGLLLIAAHASAPSWSWAKPDTAFPTPEAALAELELDPRQWAHDFVGAPERVATGPDGQFMKLKDNVLALRRR